MKDELTKAFHDLYRDPFGFDWDRLNPITERLALLEAVVHGAKIARMHGHFAQLTHALDALDNYDKEVAE